MTTDNSPSTGFMHPDTGELISLDAYNELIGAQSDPVEGDAPYDIQDVSSEESEPIHDEVYQASVMERLDQIEEAIRDLNATIHGTDEKLSATLNTVDRTLAEVTPFLDGLSKSKIGKVLGLGDTDKEIEHTHTDDKPRTKRGFF
jgi:hypothetical protein